MNTAPLQGIKVIDFTSVQSGPSCTQLLAWLGAEVIKIERPGTGDATRNELQFDPDCPSYYFLQLNSDKKSLALDAATPDGKAILTKLLETADVFIENLHPGAMDKLGFSWENVHKINPRCVYATIKGFPLSSRYKDLKAYEPVAQVTQAPPPPPAGGRDQTISPPSLARPSATPTPACIARLASSPHCCSASTLAKAASSTSRCITHASTSAESRPATS